MNQDLLLLLLGILTLGGILSGIPVAIVLMGVPFLVALFGSLSGTFDLSLLTIYPIRVYALLTNPVFQAIPFFALMGLMLEKSNLSLQMLKTIASLTGNRQAGAGMAVILMGALLAASTGIVGASVIMLAMIGLPALLEAGYSKKLASGIICATGTLGQIMPPSILLILLSDQISTAHQTASRAAGDWSAEPVTIADLFAGALLPACLLVLLFLAYVHLILKLSPAKLPSPLKETDQEKTPSLRAWFSGLILPLILIFVVLGSIFTGIATPVESAALGAGGALLIIASSRKMASSTLRNALILTSVLAAFFSLSVLLMEAGTSLQPFLRTGAFLSGASALLIATSIEFRFGSLSQALTETVLLVATLMMIVLGATMLALVFRGLGGDAHIENLLHGLPGDGGLALFFLMILLFILGFVLEFVEMIFIVVPVAAPPLLALGIDPIWLAVLIGLNLQMSFLTPPFGYSLFYFRKVAPPSILTRDIYLGVIPLIALQLLVLSLVAAFPSLANWLPGFL